MKRILLTFATLGLIPVTQAQFDFRKAGTAETYSNVNTYGSFSSSACTKSDPVACNPVTGTTVFIHHDTLMSGRRGDGLRLDWAPGASSRNWRRNLGLLNPSLARTTYNPQALVFNPANSSNPADDRVFWLANTGNAGGIIDGVVIGVCNPRARPFSSTESYHAFDSIETHIHSIAMAGNGVFYAVGNHQTEPNWVVVYKIVYNAGSGNLSFSWHTRLNTRDFSHLQGANRRSYLQQPVIAFDPSGQTGWIGLTGDTTINGGIFHPMLFKSTDGGDTWSGPYYPDIRFLNWPTLWVDDNDRLINRPRSLYDEYDLVVDKFGTPRFIAGVWQAADNNLIANSYRIDPSLNGRIIEFSSADGGANWSTREIAPIIQKEYIYTSPVVKSGLQLSNHIKASLGQGGTNYFVSWVDMDTSGRFYTPKSVSSNVAPDVFITGVDLLNNRRSCIKKPTHQHLTYDGLSFSPYLAAHCLTEARGSGFDYRLPLVMPVQPVDYVVPDAPGIEHLILGDTAMFRDYEFEAFSTNPDYEAACTSEPMGIETALMEKVKVFPNPVQASRFAMLSPGRPMQAALYDANGRQLGAWKLVPGVQLEASVAQLGAGIYFLRFEAANGATSYQHLIIP